jgi:hypothetical protein
VLGVLRALGLLGAITDGSEAFLVFTVMIVLVFIALLITVNR